MIDEGAEVNASNSSSLRTPLHWATLNGNTEIARMLIDKGAAVNVKELSGKTPLCLATTNGHSDTARLLQSVSIQDHGKAVHSVGERNGHKHAAREANRRARKADGPRI